MLGVSILLNELFQIILQMAQTGSLFQAIAYSVNATAPPFPVFVLGYAINGVGMALQVSCQFSHEPSITDLT